MTRATAICLAALLLAGCGKTVTDSACVVFSPITYSPTEDSRDTVNQIRKHNASWVVTCGERP